MRIGAHSAPAVLRQSPPTRSPFAIRVVDPQPDKAQGRFRQDRGQVLQAKELIYVEGARAIGGSHTRIIVRHILPNIMAPLLVTLTFSIPAAILAESTLSFIGLGINDPYSEWGTSWGTLAQDGWRAMRTYPHIILFPGLAIFLTILAFNFLGNGLR